MVTTDSKPRIYPKRAPQNAVYPLFRYVMVSANYPQNLRHAAGVKRARYQLDFYSLTHDDLDTAASLLHENLNGFKGQWNDIEIKRAVIADERDLDEDEAVAATDRPIYRRLFELEIVAKIRTNVLIT